LTYTGILMEGENANARDDEKFLAADAAPTLALPAVSAFVRVGICLPARLRRSQHRGKATTIVACTRDRHPRTLHALRLGSDYALAFYEGLSTPVSAVSPRSSS
jgi:hypothetical protein